MTTPVPEALPTAYEYGRVIGRFLRAVGDGEDVDAVPEAVPATGTVTFTPIITSRILIDASVEPSPLITHEPITCELDAYGHIARNGVRGVWLWTGEWTVSFNVSGMSRTPFPILVSTAHTDIAPLDLWEAAPYTPPAGTTVTTMMVPTNPTDGYVLKWSAASSSLVWGASASGPLDASTTDKGVVQLAGDLGGTATAPTVVAASETVAGKVELATTAEATTGTDTARAVTPAGVKAVADTKAAANHTHDDRYYTETESDARYLQASTAQTLNAQTGTTYTLQASDAGKLVTLTNAAAITLTVPGNVFTTGQRVDCLVLGAGMVTVVGSGATLNGTPTLVSRAQWSAFTVLFTSATAAVVVGDLASA